MFNQKANTTCNNILFKQNTMFSMDEMHISMRRLYGVFKDKKGITGQSALAHELNVSPQRVKNWEARGISKEGAMTAQAKFGCDSNWLREGLIFGSQAKTITLPLLAKEPVGNDFSTRYDAWTHEAITLLQALHPDDRKGAVALLRSYVQNLGPPRDGQALQVAG